MLYPLKFKPILKERVWGGQRIGRLLGKKYPKKSTPYGESWELSGVEGSISVVANGSLKGSTLAQLAEVYMGKLLGESIFKRFGSQFPLLIKYIDAAETLSVQVHPNDQLARERHNSFGKSEMWYVLYAEKNAQIMAGFKTRISREQFTNQLPHDGLLDLIHGEHVKEHAFFYIPAGTVHAIGEGVLLLEIQQASDITYRLYDWNRPVTPGNPRELHLDMALEAINFEANGNRALYVPVVKQLRQTLVDCPHFRVNRWTLDQRTEFNHFSIDSFIVYICLEGVANFTCQNKMQVELHAGELLLMPAEIRIFCISPRNEATLIEVYIEA